VFYGGTHGFRNVITVDMGGTSFDVALVRDGRPAITTDGSIGEHRIASPILDIHTIGAGGGSIARVETGGLLAVGPASAGAQPGPACYGRGGELPTVTDADFVLGYLDPEAFHGGQLTLDGAAAKRAIEEHVAKPLGVDVTRAADGIYQVINANMAAALGVVSVQRGYDPREFVLIVAGGAGPIHAGPIARELEIPLVLIPRESSVFCAAGMLISDLQHDYVRTYARDLDKVDTAEMTQLFNEMTASAHETLAQEGVESKRVRISYAIDLRYVGQFNEVEVPIEFRGKLGAKALEQAVQRFQQQHDSLYGYSMPGAPVELINLRVTARGLTPKPKFARTPRAKGTSTRARLGTRPAWFDGKWLRTPVYDGLQLQNGHEVKGPAIVQQPTTTIIVPADFDLKVDDFNNYLMYRKGEKLATLVRRLGRSK
jgi:N-methylhydantoinase A